MNHYNDKLAELSEKLLTAAIGSGQFSLGEDLAKWALSQAKALLAAQKMEALECVTEDLLYPEASVENELTEVKSALRDLIDEVSKGGEVRIAENVWPVFQRCVRLVKEEV